MELTKKEIEFLKESNAIEREYSEEALEDSIRAWRFAKGLTVQIDVDLIKKIHRRLMRRLNKDIAGKLRKVDVQVGLRVCMPHSAVEYHLQELCKHPINTELEIKEWHLLFEKIHPFEDGNGRTGRILMNIKRLKLGLPLLIIHEGEEQIKYYNWFK